jgi:hypothetical protein
VQRIAAKASGSALTGSAPQDPAKLCDDLNNALIEYWLRSCLNNKTAVERQATLADKVRRVAASLASLLSSNEYAIQTITSDWPNPNRSFTGLDLKDIETQQSAEPPPSLSAVLDALRRIEVNADAARSISNKWTRKGWSTDRSPLEWLAGVALSKIYERHFAEKPSIVRPAGSPSAGGRYIQFVKAIFEASEITHGGEPYSDESIARALGGRNRSRRKQR